MKTNLANLVQCFLSDAHSSTVFFFFQKGQCAGASDAEGRCLLHPAWVIWLIVLSVWSCMEMALCSRTWTLRALLDETVHRRGGRECAWCRVWCSLTVAVGAWVCDWISEKCRRSWLEKTKCLSSRVEIQILPTLHSCCEESNKMLLKYCMWHHLLLCLLIQLSPRANFSPLSLVMPLDTVID